LPDKDNLSNFGGGIALSLTGISDALGKCCQKDTQTLNNPADPLRDIQRSINELQVTVNNLHAANAASTKPYRPGFFKKILPPYGDDMYWVTQQSFTALKSMMQGVGKDGKPIPPTAENQLLLDALQESVGQPPLKKDEFINDLKIKLQKILARPKPSPTPTSDMAAAGAADKLTLQAAEAALVRWRKTILERTRAS
jgi:hypothetical protein